MFQLSGGGGGGGVWWGGGGGGLFNVQLRAIMRQITQTLEENV